MTTRYCRTCGSRLALDNRGLLCAPCERKRRDLLLRAPEVPDDFWDIDRLRDAFNSWHLGRVIAAYRGHPYHGRPLWQEVVAGWAGISQVQLSRIENGPPIKDLDRLVYWAELLGMPQRHLWFKLSQNKATPFHSTSRAGADGAAIGALLGNLTAPSLPFDTGPGPKLGITSFDGMALGQSAELLLKLFLQLDDELGGDSLYLPISRYLGRMAVSVERNPDDGLLAFGQLSQMAGWLAMDANQYGAAQRYFTSTIYVAHEADEPGLAASALAYMSLQEIYRGRLGPALSLAQTAFATGSAHITPLTHTVLGTRLARAQATLGEKKACLRMLANMRNAFDRAGQREEPLWVSYVDTAEVAAQEGACYLELGMTKEAAAALLSAIAELEQHAPHRARDHVHYLCRLAKCYLVDGEVEQACGTATEALLLNEAIGSARVTERLNEFAVALGPWQATTVVSDFRERFRLVM